VTKAIPLALTMLSSAYPNSKWSTETMKAYALMLEDIPDKQLILGVKHFIATDTSGFAPTIGQIRSSVADILVQASGLKPASLAWAEVTGFIMSHGWDDKKRNWPEFSNPAITETIKALGGWRYVCRSTDQMVDRAHFLKMYAQLIEDEKRNLVMLPETVQAIKLIGENNYEQLEPKTS
jgi:hypothetical protein